jgi:hypothetical protein
MVRLPNDPANPSLPGFGGQNRCQGRARDARTASWTICPPNLRSPGTPLANLSGKGPQPGRGSLRRRLGGAKLGGPMERDCR